ncbi:MAG: tetratricopeptide repeat protein [Gammaproteobacteria bacterium]|nr:tetratricopeptide repeat protein [Gammaproteobacteria bacterium]
MRVERGVAPAAAALLAALLGAAPAPGDAPPGLEAIRALTLELLRRGEYDDAIEGYRLIVEHRPGDARAHYDLAAALAFVRRFEEAATPAEAARRLSPEDPRVHELAALVHLNRGDPASAFAATLAGARLGDATAMYSLVGMYGEGRGVAVDRDAAYRWAERAAAAGHLGAMAWLARSNREGLNGRTVDLVEARRWAERLREAERRLDR